MPRRVVGISLSVSQTLCPRPCSSNLWSYGSRVHYLKNPAAKRVGFIVPTRHQRPHRRHPPPAPGTAPPRGPPAAAKPAAEPAAAETAAADTAAADTAAARTVHIRRDRRRWLPVRSLAVALDRARQSIAVYRNSPVANIARPRVDDVGSGVDCLSIALP